MRKCRGALQGERGCSVSCLPLSKTGFSSEGRAIYARDSGALALSSPAAAWHHVFKCQTDIFANITPAQRCLRTKLGGCCPQRLSLQCPQHYQREARSFLRQKHGDAGCRAARAGGGQGSELQPVLLSNRSSIFEPLACVGQALLGKH